MAGGTIVYDISAHKVYLPTGDIIDGHSGLREHYDNPTSVGVKMQGPTPPGAYSLEPRYDEQGKWNFFGVQALRLTPLKGTNTLGRVGLLAHTPLLKNAVPGQRSASNGCLSSQNYAMILAAYNKGCRKIVVVPQGGAQVAKSLGHPPGRLIADAETPQPAHGHQQRQQARRQPQGRRVRQVAAGEPTAPNPFAKLFGL